MTNHTTSSRVTNDSNGKNKVKSALQNDGETLQGYNTTITQEEWGISTVIMNDKWTKNLW